MRAWFLLGWSAALCAAMGCGPSEVGPPGGQDLDGPLFTRFDSRPRPDATVRTIPDAPSRITADAPGSPSLPDADLGAALSFDPPVIYVARGGTATVKVVLTEPAAADIIVSLQTTGTEASVPTSVPIAAGDTTAEITVRGQTLGDVSVTAEGGRGLIHVVPAITSIDPVGPSDILLGEDMTFTVSLESGSDIDVPVSLTADDGKIVSTDLTVTIPARATSATFTATGEALGKTSINARIGDDGPSAAVRVKGIFLSEVLYDPSGLDGGNEWIEVYNAGQKDIQLDDVFVDVALMPPFSSIGGLADPIAPGECVVFTVDTAITDGILGNGTHGDGIRLTLSDGTVLDEVIYGDDNTDGIPDENDDVPADTDVGDVISGRTIARDFDSPGFPWGQPSLVTEGDCTNF